jgi:hypothetical protein
VVREGRDGRRGVEVEEDAPEQEGEELGEGGDREHRVAPERIIGGGGGWSGSWGKWTRRRRPDGTRGGCGTEWFEAEAEDTTGRRGRIVGDRSGPMECAAVRAIHGASVAPMGRGARAREQDPVPESGGGGRARAHVSVTEGGFATSSIGRWVDA